MSVIDRIKEEMAKRHMSQNRLAKAAQISQSGLSSILNGDVSPKENTLQAIAQALDMSLYELMDEKPDQADEPEDEVDRIRKRLRHDPSFRILFSAAEKVKAENMQAAAAMLRALGDNDD